MLLDGRKGQLTARDEEILTDIFLTGFLLTSQMAAMHFSSHSTAKDRLHRLRYKGYLYYELYAPGDNLWYLTKEAFLREANNAETGETKAPLPPKERVAHDVQVNDLYVATAPGLDASLGPWPEWTWNNENRARRHYVRAGRDREYRPDAEVRFGGNLFVIERQRSDARASRGAILSRMADYADYLHNQTQEATDAHILWACDTERDMRYALEGAEKYDLYTIADGVDEVAEHMLRIAREIAGDDYDIEEDEDAVEEEADFGESA